MKKETILTALVFFGVGFLAGYAYNARSNTGVAQGQAAVTPVATSTPADAPDSVSAMGGGGDTSGQGRAGLPKGHPPLDFATTVKFFEEQASREPNNPKLPLELANYLYDQRHFDEAIPWYQKALGLDPGNIDARTDLGTAYFNLGKNDDAIREYRKSLEADPNHENTLFNLIVVNLAGKHDAAAARPYWERLHKLDPNHQGLAQLTQELQAAGAFAGSPGVAAR